MTDPKPLSSSTMPETEPTRDRPLMVRGCRGHFHVCTGVDHEDDDDLAIAGDPFPTREAAQEACDALNAGKPWPPAVASSSLREATTPPRPQHADEFDAVSEDALAAIGNDELSRAVRLFHVWDVECKANRCTRASMLRVILGDFLSRHTPPAASLSQTPPTRYDEAFTEVAPNVHVGRGEIVVTGTPPADDDPETGHNCDAMRCGSWHVLYRAKLAPAPLSQTPRGTPHRLTREEWAEIDAAILKGATPLGVHRDDAPPP